MHEQIERIFRSLHALLKTGTFTRNDLIFMHRFLTASLEMTTNLMRKAGIDEQSLS